MQRPKGRRPGRNSAADERIAQAVYKLEGWGFKLAPRKGSPSPDGVYECVADAALDRLGRSESLGGTTPLSAKSVEKIYGDWKRKRQREWTAWSRASSPDGSPFRWPLKVWSYYTRKSLEAQRFHSLKDRTLIDLAALAVAGELVRGEWDGLSSPDLEPAPDYLAKLRNGPMPVRLRESYAPPKRGRPIKRRLP